MDEKEIFAESWSNWFYTGQNFSTKLILKWLFLFLLLSMTSTFHFKLFKPFVLANFIINLDRSTDDILDL